MFTIRDIPGERKCRRLWFEAVYKCPGCPTCGSMVLHRSLYSWCGKCRKKWSSKAPTWFRGSKLSIRTLTILLMAWQQGQAPKAVRGLTGLSYPTIQRWFERFREHLPEAICEEVAVAEVDESFFGRQIFGHQTLVAGLLLKRGLLKLSVIQDRGTFSLEHFVSSHLKPGSLVFTDKHGGYNTLEDCGLTRESCNHSKGQYRETAGIENIWSRCKRRMRHQYGRFLPFALKNQLREWEARVNYPTLFENPMTYLEYCVVPL